MMSRRYVWAAVALFALAAVPTVIHNYVGLTLDDGRTTALVGPQLAGMYGVEVPRPADWVASTYGSTDFVEREYRTATGRVLRMFVARSFDAKKLYHHPELGVLHGRGFGRGERVRFSARPDVPVTVLRPESGDLGVALHAVKYGDEFIDNPITFQLGSAVRLLVGGRKPTTLFLVADLAYPADGDVEGGEALAALYAAIEAFEAGVESP